MTEANSNNEIRSTNKIIPTSWSKPWANEWSLDADTYPQSDQALQVRFAWSDGLGQSPIRDSNDFPTSSTG